MSIFDSFIDVCDAQPDRAGKVLSSDDELLNHVVWQALRKPVLNVGLMSFIVLVPSTWYLEYYR